MGGGRGTLDGPDRGRGPNPGPPGRDRAGEPAVGIYAWHLTALALCAGIVAAGLPVPDRLSATWWLTRPLWWAAVLAVTSGFVLVTAAIRTRLARRGAGPPTGSSLQAVLGVVMAAAAGGLVGLRGPRSGTLAVLCTVAFVASWLLLGGGAVTGDRDRPARPLCHSSQLGTSGT